MVNTLETIDKAIDEATDRSAPGGQDPTRFDVLQAWYPVFYVRDLDRAKPQAFTLLDIDLVIWWDRAAQQWQAFEDKCPHRLVPLSEGRIAADGLLECPYHGWAFSGSGNCERIPQEPEGEKAASSRRACAKSFSTATRQDMLFVFPGNSENADRTPIPVIGPVEAQPEGWTLFDTFRDLPYDAITLLENVLDPSHLPYTHHNSVGNRVNAAPMDLEVVTADRQGFTGKWPEGPRRGKLGPQDTIFIAPNLMWHDLTSKQFGRTITAVYATPMRKGECRLFARFPFRFNAKIPALAISITPRWYSHLGQNTILEDDQIFLYQQERSLHTFSDQNIAKAFYMPTKADRYVFEFRQWVSQWSADPFAGQPLAATQAREHLLDRYHSHTKNCASCRGALMRLRKIRVILGAVAIVALALSPVLTVLTGKLGLTIFNAVLAIGSSATWFGLGRLERRFIDGTAIPPRNRPEKPAIV
jgi:phenylpropionate dioxygenase-like ring-hydroxylating dioxygenase large terminal subunit